MTKPTPSQPVPAIDPKTASLRAELIDVVSKMSNRGMDVLIHQANELARQYPRVQCHVLTFPGGSRPKAVKGGAA